MLKKLLNKVSSTYSEAEKDISTHNREMKIQQQKIIENHNNTRARIAKKREDAGLTQCKLQ